MLTSYDVAPADKVAGIYEVPSLYVGNSTGELIRELLSSNAVQSAKVVLDAPTYQASTQTIVGHLKGTGQTDDTIILYTHSAFCFWDWGFLVLQLTFLLR